MKTDRQALEEAIELIDNPEHWTQKAYARDQDGISTFVDSPRAQQWCAVGALEKMCENSNQLGRIVWALGEELRLITHFNDSHSHSDVILALKRGLDLIDE